MHQTTNLYVPMEPYLERLQISTTHNILLPVLHRKAITEEHSLTQKMCILLDKWALAKT